MKEVAGETINDLPAEAIGEASGETKENSENSTEATARSPLFISFFKCSSNSPI